MSEFYHYDRHIMRLISMQYYDNYIIAQLKKLQNVNRIKPNDVFLSSTRNIRRPVLYALCKYLLSVVGPNINKVLQLKRWHFQCQFWTILSRILTVILNSLTIFMTLEALFNPQNCGKQPQDKDPCFIGG